MEPTTLLASPFRSGADIVPKVVVGGQNGTAGGGAGLFDSVLALLLSEKLGIGGLGEQAPRAPEVEAFRDRVRKEAIRESR